MPTRRGTKSGAEPPASAASAGAGARSSGPALVLSLQFADATHRQFLPRHRVGRWLRAALEAAPAELTVRIVGEDEGRALNREFRGKDQATNVLTFDYQRAPAVIADIVLCAPVVEREARVHGVGLDAHYAHLLVHGALHARGFDHEKQVDARRMERREADILATLGFADPYRR